MDKTVDSFLCACLHVVNETAFERSGHERCHADDDERARDQEGQEQFMCDGKTHKYCRIAVSRALGFPKRADGASIVRGKWGKNKEVAVGLG